MHPSASRVLTCCLVLCVRSPPGRDVHPCAHSVYSIQPIYLASRSGQNCREEGIRVEAAGQAIGQVCAPANGYWGRVGLSAASLTVGLELSPGLVDCIELGLVSDARR